MNLDKCGCGCTITTKNAVNKQKQKEPILSKKLLYYNCPNCDTTRFKSKKIEYSYQGYLRTELMDLPAEIREKAWKLKINQKAYHSIGKKIFVIRRSK